MQLRNTGVCLRLLLLGRRHILFHGGGAESFKELRLSPMALSGDDDSFAGKLRLPLPPIFSGKPQDWEEWSWTVTADVEMLDPQAAVFLDAHELDHLELLTIKV